MCRAWKYRIWLFFLEEGEGDGRKTVRQILKKLIASETDVNGLGLYMVEGFSVSDNETWGFVPVLETRLS
jgi:hypothetical protein